MLVFLALSSLNQMQICIRFDVGHNTPSFFCSSFCSIVLNVSCFVLFIRIGGRKEIKDGKV